MFKSVRWWCASQPSSPNTLDNTRKGLWQCKHSSVRLRSLASKCDGTESSFMLDHCVWGCGQARILGERQLPLRPLGCCLWWQRQVCSSRLPKELRIPQGPHSCGLTKCWLILVMTRACSRVCQHSVGTSEESRGWVQCGKRQCMQKVLGWVHVQGVRLWMNTALGVRLDSVLVCQSSGCTLDLLVVYNGVSSWVDSTRKLLSMHWREATRNLSEKLSWFQEDKSIVVVWKCFAMSTAQSWWSPCHVSTPTRYRLSILAIRNHPSSSKQVFFEYCHSFSALLLRGLIWILLLY